MSNISTLNSQIPNHQDTICAPATAPGGALAIIRVSGPSAFPIVSTLCPIVGEASKLCSSTIVGEASKLCSSPVVGEASKLCSKPSVHYTHFVVPAASDEVIDDVILTLFHAPHSYTGEDTVEISCHGSHYIIKRILDLLVEQGCRMATPGEFTMRAYLNGKLDLSQAEAVADLIASTNKATHDIAMSQLRGHFSSELARLRDQLLKLTSLLELELDFSDHEDLEFADRSELLDLTKTIDKHITRLADSFHAGNALKNGIPVAIVGAPNVGKSTLLNALLGEERAIVSDIQGTTRDAIEDTIQLGDITFRFIDTAGIRHTDDTIEQLGIERTYQTIERARIVLWLIDEQPCEEQQRNISKHCKGKTLIVVCNKSDKGVSVANSSLFTSHCSPIHISAKFGTGLDKLRQQLMDAVPKTTDSDVIVTNARHYEALCHAHDCLSRVSTGLEAGLSGDLIAEDLRLTLTHLAEITGGLITPQETLNNIFSRFCVGK